MLDGASMSCVNLSEVLQKPEQHDVHTEGLEYELEALGIEFRAFDLPMARPAARLSSRGSGLSFGDRACLALAREESGTAVTTEAGWSSAGIDVDLLVLR
jgi:ribonuclease VapC